MGKLQNTDSVASTHGRLHGGPLNPRPFGDYSSIAPEMVVPTPREKVIVFWDDSGRSGFHCTFSVPIEVLDTLELSAPIDVQLEDDDGGFIATAELLRVYGYGDTAVEAIAAIKSEIESLYRDLMKDDEFTGEWLQIKEFLKQRVING